MVKAAGSTRRQDAARNATANTPGLLPGQAAQACRQSRDSVARAHAATTARGARRSGADRRGARKAPRGSRCAGVAAQARAAGGAGPRTRVWRGPGASMAGAGRGDAAVAGGGRWRAAGGGRAGAAMLRPRRQALG